MTLSQKYQAAVKALAQQDSRQDIARLEKIRKQLEESQDIEEVRTLGRPFVLNAIKAQRKFIAGGCEQ